MLEIEFPRKGLAYRRTGAAAWNTSVVLTASGQEQRNRAWANPRREYSGSLILTSESSTSLSIAIYKDVERFLLMIAGQHESFRFFDELDCAGTNEPLVVVPGSSNLEWQLSKTYLLAGNSYVRSITKPITSSVKDYRGNALSDVVTVHVTGASVISIDHTTGIVTFDVAPSGTPTADFNYHIPCRLTSDKFEPEIENSPTGARLIKWNSLGLIEVRPPNY